MAEINAALSVLESRFGNFVSLSPEERHNLLKMGDKTEAFCRQTLTVVTQNSQAIPPSLDVAEAQADLVNLDKLRPRLHRLRDLLSRGDDTGMASPARHQTPSAMQIGLRAGQLILIASENVLLERL